MFGVSASSRQASRGTLVFAPGCRLSSFPPAQKLQRPCSLGNWSQGKYPALSEPYISCCKPDSLIRHMHKTECLKDCHEECILWIKLALTAYRDFLLGHDSSVAVWTGTIQGRVAVPGFAASFATKCKGHCWMWNLVCTFVSNVHMVFSSYSFHHLAQEISHDVYISFNNYEGYKNNVRKLLTKRELYISRFIPY